MREWIPIPGSARARLIEAAIEQFEDRGYEGANVTELAAAAGVTTGSLYHHFKSKLGLYRVVRDEMEKRMVERIEGAAAAVGSRGRAAAGTALLVSFDAAVRFGVSRILSEPRPDAAAADVVVETLRGVLPARGRAAAGILAAAWRAALADVAAGTPAGTARSGLAWVLRP